jgi:M6 family metalloprotease-like protein
MRERRRCIRGPSLVCAVLFGISAAPAALGAPAFGEIFNIRQPDGELVAVRIWGDEFFQHVESLDGYTLVRDPKTNIICYAALAPDGNSLLSTGIRAGTVDVDELSLPKHVRISPQAVAQLVAAARARWADGERAVLDAAIGPDAAEPGPPSSGNVQALCLIVDFSDEPGTIPPSNVDNFCNQVGYTGYGNNGSVRDYFYDVSDGHLVYTNYVPPAYYRAAHPKTYYEDPNISYGTRARELIIEALNDLESGGFDFSQYDANGDGLVDGINCFYAGYTRNAWAEGLWPHSWTVYWSADGVQTYKYQISDMGSSLSLGTFCHENGHMICYWPDLYDYDYDSRGTGAFCLMSSTGSTNPREPCAPLKDISGWSVTDLLTSPAAGLSVSAGVNHFYKYPHPTDSSEYYMIENRQQSGRDTTIADSGIAIWHVDTTGDNSYQQMTCTLHYQVTLVQADGDWDLENDRNSGDSTDLWAAPTYTTFDSLTTPAATWWCDGNAGLTIDGVSESGETMTFNFGRDGLGVSPGSDVFASGEEGGPFVPTCTAYTVENVGTDPVNWSAAGDESWFDVAPASGTLPNHGDTLVVTVCINASADALTPGNYYGTVTFTNDDTGMTTSRDVWLSVTEKGPCPADFNADGDVDLSDYGFFLSCFNGPNHPPNGVNCYQTDFDDDGDADLSDYGYFLGCYNGPEKPPACEW